MFTIEIDGLEELESEWRQLLSDVDDACKASVTKAAVDGASLARSNHPYTNRTGKLEEKTTGEYVGTKQPPVPREASLGGILGASTVANDSGYQSHWARIRAARFYASFVENGTVRSRPYPFMGQAYIKAEAVLYSELHSLVEKACAAFK